MESKRKARFMAVTAGIATGGVVLMVGLGGRLGVLCAGAILDAGWRGVSIADASDAAARTTSLAPRVVILPSTLPLTERAVVRAAASEVSAEVVELPGVIEGGYVAHALAAAVARVERRRATG
jgi:predicted metal-binding membrane protein